LFADFGLNNDGSNNLKWWIRRQALAYIFGIHPIFILMAPMLTEESLLHAVNLGAGLDISLEMLESAIEKICA
jgi:aldehyde:ferredoxin oxidoreductase